MISSILTVTYQISISVETRDPKFSKSSARKKKPNSRSPFGQAAIKISCSGQVLVYNLFCFVGIQLPWALTRWASENENSLAQQENALVWDDRTALSSFLKISIRGLLRSSCKLTRPVKENTILGIFSLGNMAFSKHDSCVRIIVFIVMYLKFRTQWILHLGLKSLFVKTKECRSWIVTI